MIKMLENVGAVYIYIYIYNLIDIIKQAFLCFVCDICER